MGGGAPLNERGGALWGALFEFLFFNAFLDAIFEPPDVILEALGVYFGSLWSAFLKLLAT